MLSLDRPPPPTDAAPFAGGCLPGTRGGIQAEAHAIMRFNEEIIEAIAEHVVAVKPPSGLL